LHRFALARIIRACINSGSGATDFGIAELLFRPTVVPDILRLFREFHSFRELSMRVLGIILICLALIPGIALAQHAPKGRPANVKAEPVEKVVNANPEADGKAFRVDLLLKNGRQVSYQFSPPEALQIADGLSKPASPGAQKLQVAALVYGMTIQADPQGRAVIMTPRDEKGNLQALAIPLIGADQLLETLKEKIAEAKAFAAKSKTPPKP
jgi:hypothetical protein